MIGSKRNRLGSVIVLTGLCLLPGTSLAGGSVEGGLTVGPDRYLEQSFTLLLDLGRYLGAKGLASFADDDESESTQFYLVGGEVRMPVGLSVGGGVTVSPEADDVKSRSYYGEAAAEFSIPRESQGFPSAVRLTSEKRTYSIRPETRWFDIEQTGFGVQWIQTLFYDYAVSIEYWTYSYDRDLDSLARRVTATGARRRNLNLLDISGYVSTLPDWILGLGFDFSPTDAIRVGLNYSRIQPESDISGGSENQYAAEVGYLFLGALEVSLGLAAYDSFEGTDLYASTRVAYSF